MDTQRRHPWRGLRDFLKEVAIVVLGVLLALAGGQAVDQLNWTQKAQELQADMRAELIDDDMPKAVERIASGECLFTVLDRISDAAEGGANRTDLIALMREYRIGLLIWDMDAWRGLLAADSAGHIPVGRLRAWSKPYALIPDLQRLAQKERDDLAQLRGLRDAPGPLSEPEKIAVAHGVELLRTSNRHILAYSKQFMLALKTTGLEPTQAMLDRAYANVEPDEVAACAVKPTRETVILPTTAAVGQPQRRSPPTPTAPSP